MTKQQFLDASLHTGLKVSLRSGKIEPLFGIVSDIFYTDSNDMSYTIDDIKPILRPLSDLTKPITHNGETFVPIIELAKMAWVNERVDFKFQSLKDETVFIAFSDKKNVFGYDANTNSFFGAIDEKSCSVVNQLQLFQKLIEWNFNLMDESEPFIPVTEEFNPYK